MEPGGHSVVKERVILQVVVVFRVLEGHQSLGKYLYCIVMGSVKFHNPGFGCNARTDSQSIKGCFQGSVYALY